MKILCGVMGAEAHILSGIHQASRETWMREFSKYGDCRFFVGNGSVPLQDDEIRVDVPDDKAHILHKTVEILKYSKANGYDMTLKIDTDTYVNADVIMRRSLENLDYVGAPVGTIREKYAGTAAWSFLQGSATWLSPKAAQIVIDKAIPTMLNLMPSFQQYNGLICPYPHAEDLWIGQTLAPYLNSGELTYLSDPDYSHGPLTYHFALSVKEEGFQRWMHQLHDNRFSEEKMREIHNARSER